MQSRYALVLAAALAVSLPLTLPHLLPRASADGPTATVPPATRPFPTIAVSGTTELAIAPDEAWVHVGVETFFTSLDASVADNDKRMAGVLKALRDAGIGPSDLTTSTMTLMETDRYEGGDKKTHGFQVSRALVARVRDLARLEAILQAVVKSGATHLREVKLTHSQLAAKKAEARTAAVKAAREKATAMAGALGQGVGRAVAVREAGGGSAMASASSNYANEVLNFGGATIDSATIAAGRIRVEVTVAVDFELL